MAAAYKRLLPVKTVAVCFPQHLQYHAPWGCVDINVSVLPTVGRGKGACSHLIFREEETGAGSLLTAFFLLIVTQVSSMPVASAERGDSGQDGRSQP